MGLFQSKPDPFLSNPWRKINWTNSEEPLHYIKNYKSPVEGQKIRVLLYGPVGAGKSSFVNSIQRALLGRMYNQALVANITERGFTKKFNPRSKLSEDNSQFYNKSPTFRDKVHVLVCVVPADKGPNTVKEKTLHKIQDIRKEASSRGIPQLVLLTKIDQLCPEIQDDLKNVYRLKSVKQKMEQFQADVGIPMNCIFPVKNYHEEINLDDKVDSLLLSAVRNIITAGGNYIHKKSSM